MSRRARGYQPLHRSAEQSALLARVVAFAEANAGAVGVFDLDGCVFDTRPRQIHIFRELASARGWPELYAVTPEHFVDWDHARTLRNAGIEAGRVAELLPAVREAFYQSFFKGEYVLHDHAMPGAAQLVWACYRAGLVIVYLTGRHEDMRAHTEIALGRFGFPWARPRTHLLVKPDFSTSDLAFKGEALREVGLLGRPALFLDNEPANINLFHAAHPEALCVWVETDHSPRPDEPHPEIPGLRGFLR